MSDDMKVMTIITDVPLLIQTFASLYFSDSSQLCCWILKILIILETKQKANGQIKLETAVALSGYRNIQGLFRPRQKEHNCYENREKKNKSLISQVLVT